MLETIQVYRRRGPVPETVKKGWLFVPNAFGVGFCVPYPAKWWDAWLSALVLKATFLLHSFLTNRHVHGNWAFSCPVHSKIQVSDLDVLNEPFHE